MKVIGAKSLVQMIPSVVTANQRATPGVYGYDSNQPPVISCEGATNQLVISASYSVDPVPYERWKMEITDAVTGVLFTSLTNLTYVEPDHLSVSLTKNKTPECPFDFSLQDEINFNTIIQNASGSDVRMKLKFVELVDDGQDLTIEFWVQEGSTPVNWIKEIEGEDYELTACLSSQAGISCEGSTDSFKLTFAIADGETPAISYVSYVDGVQQDIINDTPVWLTKEILPDMSTGEVPSGFYISNGVYKFTNTDSIQHRIEIAVTDTNMTRAIVSESGAIIQVTPDTLGADVGICLSPESSAGNVSWLAVFNVEELDGSPTKTINLNIDGELHTNLPISTGVDGLWNEVPVMVTLGSEGLDLVVQTFNTQPITELSVSSPNFKLVQIPNEDLPPEFSYTTVVGNSVGNTGTTSLLEYVGSTINDDYVVLSKEWVTSSGTHAVGMGNYLTGGTSGEVVTGTYLGQNHATVDDAVTFFMTYQSSHLGGKTVAEACNLNFEKDVNGDLKVTSTALSAMTLLMLASSGDYSNLFTPSSPNQSSARQRGEYKVTRLGATV